MQPTVSSSPRGSHRGGAQQSAATSPSFLSSFSPFSFPHSHSWDAVVEGLAVWPCPLLRMIPSRPDAPCAVHSTYPHLYKHHHGHQTLTLSVPREFLPNRTTAVVWCGEEGEKGAGVGRSWVRGEDGGRPRELLRHDVGSRTYIPYFLCSPPHRDVFTASRLLH
jgi:hypothetical protein